MKLSIYHTVIALAGCVLLGNSIDTLGQSSQKSSAKRGYLSRPQPGGLRFAPPPKPPVAYLPPLPITFDPQPVFSPEFAQPGTELPTPPTKRPVQSPSSSLPSSVPVTEIVSSIFDGPRKGKIPVDNANVGMVSPQMLVRFFQNGEAKEIEIPIGNPLEAPLSFRVPVKVSSSASYEVK